MCKIFSHILGHRHLNSIKNTWIFTKTQQPIYTNPIGLQRPIQFLQKYTSQQQILEFLWKLTVWPAGNINALKYWESQKPTTRQYIFTAKMWKQTTSIALHSESFLANRIWKLNKILRYAFDYKVSKQFLVAF